MPLQYLLDEDLRGPLWNAVLRHNSRGVDVINVLRVGDPPAPLLESLDPELLIWAERHERILVTFDKSTMRPHLDAHLRAGHSSPGIFQVRAKASIPEMIEYLVLAAHASDPGEWRNQCTFIP